MTLLSRSSLFGEGCFLDCYSISHTLGRKTVVARSTDTVINTLIYCVSDQHALVHTVLDSATRSHNLPVDVL
jgi:hypothetical protein